MKNATTEMGFSSPPNQQQKNRSLGGGGCQYAYVFFR